MPFLHQQTIRRLAVRWRDEPRGARGPATQLRLERLLGGLDLHPPGLPPGAILIIRRLAGLPPLSGLAGLPRGWERRLEERVMACYSAAVPPGPAAAQAPAVLFADAAELLITLSGVVAREPGGFLRPWYLRELIPPAARRPGAALAYAWASYAHALPAALAELPARERADALALLAPAELHEVAVALCSAYDLPARGPGWFPTQAIAWGGQARAEPFPGATAKVATTALLDLALGLYRDPAGMRAALLAPRAAPPLEAGPAATGAPPGAKQSPVSPPRPGPRGTPEARTAENQPPPLAAQWDGGHSSPMIRGHEPGRAAPLTPSAPHPAGGNAGSARPAPPLALPGDGPPAPIAAPTEPLVPPVMAAASPAPPAAAEQPVASARPVLPAGAATELGGVLYLINLFARIGWPRPGMPAGWLLLEAVARGLLAVADDEDSLWPLLAELGGRAPGTPLSPGPIALMPATDSAAPLLAATLDPELRARLGPGLAGWVAWACDELGPLLGQLLDGPPVELLRRRGRLVLSRTHLDLYMTMDQISLPVRRAGLDANPGWQPDLGYIVLFHFVESQ